MIFPVQVTMSTSAVLALLIGLIGIQNCDAIARTIRVPLTRATTQGSGTLGQPVISYFTPINIGTPAKAYNLQFDVGFNDIFLPHHRWTSFINTNLHYSRGYRCKESSTCTRKDISVTIDYQQCRLTGKPYEDTFVMTSIVASMSNGSLHPVPVQYKQNFLAMSSASDARFRDLPVDGFIGLGPRPESGSGIRNILGSLHLSGLIDLPQFSIWFNPVLDSPQGGELILGGVDESRFSGQVYWHKLSALSNQWSLALQHVSLGSKIVGCNNGQRCQAILSSGLSDIYGPKSQVEQIYDLLNIASDPSGLKLIDCKRISNLPILYFNIDGIPYTVLPSNYVRKMTQGSVFKKEICYVAILSSDGDDSEKWTLGTNFLGAYYSIFDISYSQIGFASLNVH